MYQHSMCPFFVQEGSTSLIGFTKLKNEAMHKGNSNLQLHLSIHCFLYLYTPKIILALFSLNIMIDLSQTFLIRICNIYICPNRVLIYIIDRINVIIIMYIFLGDDILNHVRRRRTLFWCRRRPCHYTKITFIKSKIQDATLDSPNRDITNSISKSHFIPSSTFSIIFPFAFNVVFRWPRNLIHNYS